MVRPLWREDGSVICQWATKFNINYTYIGTWITLCLWGAVAAHSVRTEAHQVSASQGFRCTQRIRAHLRTLYFYNMAMMRHVIRTHDVIRRGCAALSCLHPSPFREMHFAKSVRRGRGNWGLRFCFALRIFIGHVNRWGGGGLPKIVFNFAFINIRVFPPPSNLSNSLYLHRTDLTPCSRSFLRS
jgi:hypothetical protein